MKYKKNYEAPAILRTTPFRMESTILAGSIVDKATVVSQGQQVDTYNFESNEFNHTWED